MKYYLFTFYRQFWPNGGRGNWLGHHSAHTVAEAEEWAGWLRNKALAEGYRIWMEVKLTTIEAP